MKVFCLILVLCVAFQEDVLAQRRFSAKSTTSEASARRPPTTETSTTARSRGQRRFSAKVDLDEFVSDAPNPSRKPTYRSRQEPFKSYEVNEKVDDIPRDEAVRKPLKVRVLSDRKIPLAKDIKPLQIPILISEKDEIAKPLPIPEISTETEVVSAKSKEEETIVSMSTAELVKSSSAPQLAEVSKISSGTSPTPSLTENKRPTHRRFNIVRTTETSISSTEKKNAQESNVLRRKVSRTQIKPAESSTTTPSTQNRRSSRVNVTRRRLENVAEASNPLHLRATLEPSPVYETTRDLTARSRPHRTVNSSIQKRTFQQDKLDDSTILSSTTARSRRQRTSKPKLQVSSTPATRSRNYQRTTSEEPSSSSQSSRRSSVSRPKSTFSSRRLAKLDDFSTSSTKEYQVRLPPPTDALLPVNSSPVVTRSESVSVDSKTEKTVRRVYKKKSSSLLPSKTTSKQEDQVQVSHVTEISSVTRKVPARKAYAKKKSSLEDSVQEGDNYPPNFIANLKNKKGKGSSSSNSSEDLLGTKNVDRGVPSSGVSATLESPVLSDSESVESVATDVNLIVSGSTVRSAKRFGKPSLTNSDSVSSGKYHAKFKSNRGQVPTLTTTTPRIAQFKSKSYLPKAPKGLYSSRKFSKSSTNSPEDLESVKVKKFNLETAILSTPVPSKGLNHSAGNKFSSRYRSDSRPSILTRSSTSGPPYIPTIPTVTPTPPSIKIESNVMGLEVISLEDTVSNTVPSANLINGDYLNSSTPDTANVEKGPVSILEAIINSINSISTTNSPQQTDSTTTTFSPLTTTQEPTPGSAILRLVSRRPSGDVETTDQTNNNDQKTTEIPTTVIEKIISSLSALRANTDSEQVGTTTPINLATSTISSLDVTSTSEGTFPTSTFSSITSSEPVALSIEEQLLTTLPRRTVTDLLNILNLAPSTTTSKPTSTRVVVVTPKITTFIDESVTTTDVGTSTIRSDSSDSSLGIEISTVTERNLESSTTDSTSTIDLSNFTKTPQTTVSSITETKTTTEFPININEFFSIGETSTINSTSIPDSTTESVTILGIDEGVIGKGGTVEVENKNVDVTTDGTLSTSAFSTTTLLSTPAVTTSSAPVTTSTIPTTESIADNLIIPNPLSASNSLRNSPPELLSIIDLISQLMTSTVDTFTTDSLTTVDSSSTLASFVTDRTDKSTGSAETTVGVTINDGDSKTTTTERVTTDSRSVVTTLESTTSSSIETTSTFPSIMERFEVNLEPNPLSINSQSSNKLNVGSIPLLNDLLGKNTLKAFNRIVNQTTGGIGPNQTGVKVETLKVDPLVESRFNNPSTSSTSTVVPTTTSTTTSTIPFTTSTRSSTPIPTTSTTPAITISSTISTFTTLSTTVTVPTTTATTTVTIPTTTVPTTSTAPTTTSATTVPTTSTAPTTTTTTVPTTTTITVPTTTSTTTVPTTTSSTTVPTTTVPSTTSIVPSTITSSTIITTSTIPSTITTTPITTTIVTVTPETKTPSILSTLVTSPVPNVSTTLQIDSTGTLTSDGTLNEIEPNPLAIPEIVTNKIEATTSAEDILNELTKNKKLTPQQQKDLDTLKALEREQKALLQQLSFLTGLNIGSQKTNAENLSQKIVALAENQTKAAKETPEELNILKDLGLNTLKQKPNKLPSLPSIENLIKQTPTTQPVLSSTYGKTDEALLASLLKEYGVAPTPPKSLEDAYKNDIKPITSPRPKPSTTRRRAATTTSAPSPGSRLMQGINWLLSTLNPPPSTTRKPKIKPTKPAKLQIQDNEVLSKQPTAITPVVVDPPSNFGLTQDRLNSLIDQLAEVQKNPAQVKNLDKETLRDLKKLNLGTKKQENLAQQSAKVQVISSGTNGVVSTNKPNVLSTSSIVLEDEFSGSTTIQPRPDRSNQAATSSSTSLPPVKLKSVPGVPDNGAPLIRGQLVDYAINVTKAISSFLGSALQDASEQFVNAISTTSGRVNGLFNSSSVDAKDVPKNVNNS